MLASIICNYGTFFRGFKSTLKLGAYERMAYLKDLQRKVWILLKFGFRNKSQLLDLLRRTRATNLYQSDVELELVSRILGHASTQTTRIYAKPSLEMIKSAMNRSNPELNAEQPLWPDDEVELARIFGIR